MALVSDIVKRGMRRLAILQAGEEPSADEMQDGVTLLNEMLHAWELDGIKLNHSDLVQTDTLPYPDDHHAAIINGFAVRYADEFGKSVPQTVIALASNGYTNLQHYYLEIDDLQIDSGLDPYYNANGWNW